MTDLTVAVVFTADASGALRVTKETQASIDALTGAQKKALQATLELTNAERSAEKAARNHQLAVRQLGFQISDIGTGLTSGQSPFLILAQQSGQVAQALAGMRGAAGAVGAFLAGPWGAALVTAGVIAAQFASQLFASSDASKAAEKAADAHAEAIKRLTEAQRAQVTTAQDAANADLKSGQSGVAELLKERTRLTTQLRDARATAFRTVAGGQLVKRDVDTSDIEQQIAANEKALAEARRLVTAGEIALSDQRVKIATDATARINAARDAEIDRINEQVQAGLLSVAAAEQRKIAVVRKTQDEIDALRGRSAKVEKAQVDAAASAWEGLRAQYLPVAAFEAERLRTLKEIDVAERAGLATAQQAAQIRAAIGAEGSGLGPLIDRVAGQGPAVKVAQLKPLGDSLDVDASRRALEAPLINVNEQVWQDYTRRGEEAISGLADLIGGKFGRALTGVAGLIRTAGVLSGGAGEAGGPGGGALGGLARLFGGDAGRGAGTRPADGGFLGEIQKGFGKEIGELTEELGKQFKSLTDSFGKLFGKGPDGLGSLIGEGLAGAGVGSAVGGLLGVAGVEGPGVGIGSTLGGALGAFTGIPGGSILGGLAGGLLGSLFGKSKTRGAATLTTTDGGTSLSNVYGGGSRDDTARDLGGAVGDRLQQFADTLGSRLVAGIGLGSIGSRGEQFTYDPSGRGLTRESSVLKFKDAEGAVNAALLDGLKKGAVALTAFQQRVVATADSVEEAADKIKRVQEIEDLLADRFTVGLVTELRDFDAQARQRNRIAQEAGFDLVKLEQRNAEDRAAIIKAFGDEATASLSDALDQLRLGSSSPLSARERLAGLGANFSATVAAARGGDQAKIDEAAGLGVQIAGLANEIFASGPEFARVYADITATLEQLKAETVAAVDKAAGGDAAAQQDPLVPVTIEGFAGTIDGLAGVRLSLDALAKAFADAASAGRAGNAVIVAGAL